MFALFFSSCSHISQKFNLSLSQQTNIPVDSRWEKWSEKKKKKPNECENRWKDLSFLTVFLFWIWFYILLVFALVKYFLSCLFRLTKFGQENIQQRIFVYLSHITTILKNNLRHNIPTTEIMLLTYMYYILYTHIYDCL